MSTTAVVYRVRVRASDDTTDALVVSTATGVGVPCLAGVPHGEGTEIDPWAGTVTVGSYTAELLDVETSPGVRVLTSILVAADGRSHWLGRRCYVEIQTNGGAWVVLVAGYVTGLALTGALRWALTIGESRRIELYATAFGPRVTGLDAAGYPTYEDLSTFYARWPYRGGLVGGPVTGPRPGDPAFDLSGLDFVWHNTGRPGLPFARQFGGWRVHVLGTDTTNPDRPITRIRPDKGYGPSDYQIKTAHADLLSISDRGTGSFRQVATNPSITGGVQVANFPALAAVLMPDGAASGSLPVVCGFGDYPAQDMDYVRLAGGSGLATQQLNVGQGVFVRETFTYYLRGVPYTVKDTMTARLNTTGVTLPQDVDASMHVISTTPTPQSPLYWSGHPVDLIARLWTEARVDYDPASIEYCRGVLGADRRLTLRQTSAPTLVQFFEHTMFGPFGLSARPSRLSGGGWSLVPTRISRLLGAGAASSMATIDAASVPQSAPGQVWQQDDGSVITKVSMDGERYLPWPAHATADQAPPDGTVVQHEHVERVTGDVRQVGQRELNFAVSGMMHTDGMLPDLEATVVTLAKDVADRASQGMRVATASVFRGTAAYGIQVGDLAVLDLPHLPSNNRRRQDSPSTTQGQLVQCVRRAETATGADLKILDAGVNVQAAALVPALTLAAVSGQRLRATVTVTNYAEIAADAAVVRFETAFTADGSTPSATAGGEIATVGATSAPILLPALVSTGTLWVRGRVEPTAPLTAGFSVGAWSSWAGIPLAGLPAVTGLTATASTDDGGALVLAWGAPSGGWLSADDIARADVEVWYRVTANPADVGPGGTSIRALVLPPQSTQAVLSLLPLGVNVTVAVVLRDQTTGGLGVASTAAATTGGTAAALPAVSRTAGYVTPLHACGLGVDAGTIAGRVCDVEVACEIETDVGSGVYALSTSGTSSGAVGDWTVPIEVTPANNGKRVQFRGRNRRPGSPGVGDAVASGDAGAWSAYTPLNPWGAAVALPPYTIAGAGTPGPKGDTGSQGPPGAQGIPGTSGYEWVAYANRPDGTLDFTTGEPNAGGILRAYQGLAFNKPSATESTNAADYSWTHYVGPVGLGVVPFGTGAIIGNTFAKYSGAYLPESGVYTDIGWSGGATVSGSVRVATKDSGLGLDASPGSHTSDFTQASYFLSASASGYLIPRVNGTAISGAANPAYAVGDALEVRNDGDTVHYLRNGVSFATTPAPAVTVPLYAIWGIQTPGGAFGGCAAGSVGAKGATGAAGAPGTSPASAFASASVTLVAPNKFQINYTLAAGYNPASVTVTASLEWTTGAGAQRYDSAGGIASGTQVPAGVTIYATDPGGGSQLGVGLALQAMFGSVAIGSTTAAANYWIAGGGVSGPGGPGSGSQILPSTSPTGGP